MKEEPTIAVLIMIVVMGAFFASGYKVGSNDRDTAIAAAQAKMEQAYSAKAAKSINEQVEKNDKVVTRLSNAIDGNEKTRKKVSDAARNTTVYRYCLDSNTLRVLNNELGFSVLPAAAAAPQAATGTAQTDAGIATDANVVDWITQTAAQYQDCRARLSAWADWAKEHGGGDDAGN